MVQITVSDDLARAIAEAGPLVTLVDSHGRTVARVAPIDGAERPPGMTEERWKEIQSRLQSPGAYISYQEMKTRLGW
jgi:antitoxin (DNA-binding transcriptional repressor) of toxin-antitoxin stability system